MAMTVRDWVSTSVASAGVVAGVAGAAINNDIRLALAGFAVTIVVGAVSWGALSSRERTTFAIDALDINESVVAGSMTTFHGRTGRWDPANTLWFFIEDQDAGNRVWVFGGEARIQGGAFFYDFTPSAQHRGRRLTLTAV